VESRKRWQNLQLCCTIPAASSLCVLFLWSLPKYPRLSVRGLGVDASARRGVKSVNHVVVELRMFLSEAPYWSRPPRQGFWTSQRRLAINVISDGKGACCGLCIGVGVDVTMYRALAS